MTDGLTGRHAALLQKVDLFAGLDRMALAQVAAFVEAVTVQEGEVVFHQGESGDALYIVARGKFGVFVSLPDAPTEVRLTTLRPGDVFGEMALLTDEPRSATVRNEEGAGEVLRLERSKFFELIRREPTLVHSIAATLTRRLQANARIILQSEHFIVSVVDQALGRVDPERRRKILEASVMDEITPEALAALFGPDAGEVTRNLGECGIVPGQPAGPVLRVLRERLERELGMEYWQQYAQNAAARLAEAGIWPAALSLYAHYAPRPGFIDALGRALRDARRLNTAVARLALAAGQDSTAALQYGIQPVRVRLARPIGTSVMLVAGAAVLAAIALLFPLAPAAKFVLLLGAAVFLWVSEVLPMAAVSLFLLAAWLVTGVATAEQATHGFGSKDWLFVLALLGLAAAIARSGLLFRVGLMLIRHMPQGLFWQAGTLMLSGLLLGPFLPMAMGRVALTAPLALGVSQALRLRDREPAAAVLGLAAWIGAGPLFFTFLNASPACLLAWGLLPARRQAGDAFRKVKNRGP